MALKTTLYRSKQAHDWKVRAVEVTEKNLDAVAKWIGQWHPVEVKESVTKKGIVKNRRIVITTPLGVRAARPGQFISRDVSERMKPNASGNWYVWYVLDKDTFLKNSEPVPA